MVKKFVFIILSFFLISPIYAVRSLPPGVQPESKAGEATGTFPALRGSGTLTFVNIGGEAKLVTVCGDTAGTGANSVTCTGIDVAGTFTGGPYGVAVFKTDSGSELKFQLNDGKVFSYSASGISMDFTVTNPSIFDAWIENPGARDSGARVSDLSGQVEIACPPDLEAWDVMKMGRVIYVDCHLKTGEDSKAVISFSDMTTFEMKSESEIVIDTPPEKESKWSLLAGNIWVNVKQMVKDGTMKVHMSQAVAGIKGTTFVLTETGTESKLEVIEGLVNFESLTTGKTIDVMAGESVVATAGGLSAKTSSNSATPKIIPQNPNIMYYAGGALIVLIIIIVIVSGKKSHAVHKNHP